MSAAKCYDAYEFPNRVIFFINDFLFHIQVQLYELNNGIGSLHLLLINGLG
jgi:hypothetical protein